MILFLSFTSLLHTFDFTHHFSYKALLNAVKTKNAVFLILLVQRVI